MAENGNGVAAPQQQTQQQEGRCTGDCKKCMPWQRVYCSSQIAYNNMRMLEALAEGQAALERNVKNLSEKVEAIMNAEGMLIEPAGEQQGDEGDEASTELKPTQNVKTFDK